MGNLKGYPIQEPSSTLEQLLTQLTGSIAFDVEIKYPRPWEAKGVGWNPTQYNSTFTSISCEHGLLAVW